MKINIALYIALFYCAVLLNSCKPSIENNSIKNLIQCYKEAINQHDYSIIEPCLSNDFRTNDSDLNSSLIEFYSYINSNQSRKIDRVKINKVENLNDSTICVDACQYFHNDEVRGNITFIFKETNRLRLYKLINYFPVNSSITTRASYVNEEVFGINRIKSIKNLSIIDIKSGDSISGQHFTTFYDNPTLRDDAFTALQLFEKLDSLLTYDFGFYDIERENLFLTTINSRNTCTIGNSRKIPWTMALYETDSINNLKMINKIGNTFSHEIVEGCLIVKYKLNGYDFRWFRDGLSDYIAYKFCSLISPDEAQRYFLDNRLADARKHQQNGNLLDWRGNNPIASVDTGKIYGDRYIYSNEVGQYGRAFKLFKDLFDNNPQQISEILQAISEINNITVSDLMRIMDKVTYSNMEDLISKY
ncbi:hypothetical protein [Saccharicrinis aurantiacus]|uniref:hypothetical protein n=1 Tax=Saccharicrinis aurantiacus TaxID=1849719 RepID=UPI00094FE741|nr:hypothetical protein [Saccharicrinis aurantiacus]